MLHPERTCTGCAGAHRRFSVQHSEVLRVSQDSLGAAAGGRARLWSPPASPAEPVWLHTAGGLEHLPPQARAADVRKVPRRRHLRAQPRQKLVQRVRRRRGRMHLRAQARAEQVQAVPGRGGRGQVALQAPAALGQVQRVLPVEKMRAPAHPAPLQGLHGAPARTKPSRAPGSELPSAAVEFAAAAAAPRIGTPARHSAQQSAAAGREGGGRRTLGAL